MSSSTFPTHAWRAAPLLVVALAASACDGHGAEYTSRANGGTSATTTTSGTTSGTGTGTDLGGAGGAFPASGCVNGWDQPVTEKHFTVVDPGTGSCSLAGYDGSGSLRDDGTGLVWDLYPKFSIDGFKLADADAWCKGRGARLPTHDEAEYVTEERYDSCAWPCGWVTWTSTEFDAGRNWVVFGGGVEVTVPVDLVENYTLCVR